MNIKNKGARRRLLKQMSETVRIGNPVERTKRELRLNPAFRAQIQREMKVERERKQAAVAQRAQKAGIALPEKLKLVEPNRKGE